MKKVLIALSIALWMLAPAALFATGNAPGSPAGIEQTQAHSATAFPVFSDPYLVQSYGLRCSSSGSLTVQVRDGGIAGDHWEVTLALYDQKPSTGIAVATGSLSVYRSVVLTSFGGNPIQGRINVRYLHGINDFPAVLELVVICSDPTATLTLTDLGQAVDNLQ